MKKRVLGIAIICFFLLTAALGQDGGQGKEPAAASLTFEQLVKSARVYFRDSTEFPMTQRTTVTVSDAAGRVRKVKEQTLEYLFNGYNRGSNTASSRLRGHVSFWDAMHGEKTLKASMNSSLWVMMAGTTLYRDPAKHFALEPGKSGEGNGLITARLTPVKPCPAFSMTKNAQNYMPDGTCGVEEYQLQDDLSFQKFAIEISGLPVEMKMDPFGDCRLQQYHAEVEFQRVSLQGDQEPFLVPRQVTATLQTNKGKVVIKSVYEPKRRQ